MGVLDKAALQKLIQAIGFVIGSECELLHEDV